jgi:hypothetical protein
MRSLENNDMMNDFPESSQFKEKLETLEQQLPAILTDFKKYYVFYNKNPEYPEYQQSFENIKGNLNKVNSDLFILSNSIQSTTDVLNTNLKELYILIEKEKKINSDLKRKLGIVENTNNASTELISDYKEIYESEYLKNWGLFFSILIAGSIISKTYKSTNYTPNL